MKTEDYTMLGKAIIVAENAHNGQVDKGGKPFILHPMRVMFGCRTIEAKIVAVLHDFLEDTDFTENELRYYGFPNDIIDAVACLTRSKNENYFDYIDRVKRNPIAIEVKMADLKDNMDLSRLQTVTDYDLKRQEKYKKAYEILKQC